MKRDTMRGMKRETLCNVMCDTDVFYPATRTDIVGCGAVCISSSPFCDTIAFCMIANWGFACSPRLVLNGIFCALICHFAFAQVPLVWLGLLWRKKRRLLLRRRGSDASNAIVTMAKQQHARRRAASSSTQGYYSCLAILSDLSDSVYVQVALAFGLVEHDLHSSSHVPRCDDCALVLAPLPFYPSPPPSTSPIPFYSCLLFPFLPVNSPSGKSWSSLGGVGGMTRHHDGLGAYSFLFSAYR